MSVSICRRSELERGPYEITFNILIIKYICVTFSAMLQIRDEIFFRYPVRKMGCVALGSLESSFNQIYRGLLHFIIPTLILRVEIPKVMRKDYLPDKFI
jgi:hypothetical protein